MLSTAKENEVLRVFSKFKFEQRTPKSIASIQELIERLREIHNQGYSIDDEELALGMRCIAAPIFNFTGNCIAAISLAGPTIRMTDDRIKEIKEAIIFVSKTISMKLGWSSYVTENERR